MTSCPASVEHCLHHSMHQLAHSILVIWSVTLGHTHICYIKGHTPVPNCGVYWGDHCAVWKGKVWSFCLTNEFGTVPRQNLAISCAYSASSSDTSKVVWGDCNVLWWQLVLQHDHTLPLCTKGCGLWDEEEETTLSWQPVNCVCGGTLSTQNRP